MRAVLLDTNAHTASMLGAAEVVDVVAHADRLYLNSIVLGELLGGFAAGTREPKNRA
jgi:predicted nucleic acid-binding protein